jgi:hypothetical protein
MACRKGCLVAGLCFSPMLQGRQLSSKNCIGIYHLSLCNNLQDVVPKFPTKCDVEWVDAEDPLFLLYTSGSTGKPKVLVIKLDYLDIALNQILITPRVYRVCCILQGATWCILQQPLSMHLITSQRIYTGKT